MKTFVYDGKFEGNILVVGKAGCRKNYFVQRLVANNISGEFQKVEWVSQIKLPEQREAQLQYCFTSHVEFHYPTTADKL